MTKTLSMKSTKQEIYSAYSQATQTVEELQQSELKTAVIHFISNAITFVLYQLRGDKLGETMKRLASAMVPVLVFLFGVYRAFAKKVPAGDNPWGEGVSTLEWTLTSPPPFHQFGDLPEPVDFGSFSNPGSLQGAVTDVTRDADH